VVRVWDRAIRVLHWALAASVGLGWATTVWFGDWHQRVGYVALAVVVVRLVWGWRGPRYARFAQFVRVPAAVWRYARLVSQRREPRYLGHNPLGACMAIAFLACIGALALTGWMYTTDRFWGDETVERVHIALAWTIAVFAVLHVVGVLAASARHRENLSAAMLHGVKRDAAPGDVD
jgi:cytochrome b